MRKYGFLALFLILPVLAMAQASPDQDVFTITIAPPISAQDVQVRYLLGGDPTVRQASSVARPEGNRIVVETTVAGKPASGFRAFLYSPGCQFVTVTADDLSASTRQAQFECQKLATTPLHGKVDVSRFSGKPLQVEVLYKCNWAEKFFSVPSLMISPLAVTKVKMGDDGSFALELPDFTADPLWNSLSHNAGLALVLVDPANGERLGWLIASPDLQLKHGPGLKIAASYPAEVEFTIQ